MKFQVSLGPRAIKECINTRFAGREPWQVAAITATSVLAGVWVWNIVFQPESIVSRGKKFFFRMARKIPAVANKINKELSKISSDFEKDVKERMGHTNYNRVLQVKGKSKEEIIEELKKNLDLGHYRWDKGFVSGAVYYFSPELINLLTEVYGLASYTNPLHADIFPGVNKMESEVVSISTDLFHGSSKACGTMTSGGTESIIMACKAFRDYGREERGITNPEMILPRTAHPAFEKAAFYFGIRICYIPVDPLTTSVIIKKVKQAINSNTIMIVGSVPNYPYGTMDDIEALASLGRRYGVPVHVDCCLGGFLTAFMPQAGFELPPFDFSVPGVTSISADTHKYGFAPKGSSVVLYSKPEYRHYQYCVTTDWPGGVYGSPTINGSRAGGIIAACWATLMYFGLEGYVKSTRKIIETTKYIERELRMIPEIFIFGKPITSVIAIGSEVFHIYRLSEILNDLGWNLNPLQFPPGVHLCVTHMHVAEGIADRFVQDVKNTVKIIMNDPKSEVKGKMAMYGKSQSIPDRSIVSDFTKLYLDSTYYVPHEANSSN
ncbi:sphingosine-1-phosphate lyase isoform X2 [Cimex lectularius]|nr:sphingosine-1-phosphate lyase isoform X2 [Cimex lectularius]